MSSCLIAKNNIDKFILDTYGTSDPVMCVWTDKEPPVYDDETVVNLDNAHLFIKEDVESMFFPNGNEAKWNLVLVCLKQYTQPILGWIAGTTPEEFLKKMYY
jgi:hypothetical protein